MTLGPYREIGFALTVGALVSVSVVGARGVSGQSPPQSLQAEESLPPLVEAIWKQDLEKVKKLLADCADPTATTTSGAGRPGWMWGHHCAGRPPYTFCSRK